MFKGQQIKPAWTEVLNTVHGEASKWGSIEMTGKGWTTNEVGLCWLKEKFTPWAKNQLRGTYCMLIINNHRSHVSLEFNEYCTQNQIVALCLLSHTTHILQPLDVRIFGPLANAYKLFIEKKCRYRTGRSVDKTAFLKHYIEAREKAISPKNILSAWIAAGLIPLNPEHVMTKRSLGTGPSKSLTSHFSRPSSPTSLSLPFNNSSSSLEVLTPIASLVELFSNVSLSESSSTVEQVYSLKSTYLQNIENVDLIVQRLQNGTPRQDLRIAQLAQTAKLGIAQQIVSSKVNDELLESMRHKKKQGKSSRKRVYKMRHLNVQEAEAFRAKEEKKEQNNLRKKQKAEARKLAQERKAKEKEERAKEKAAQKAIFELEKAQKAASQLDAKEKKELKRRDDNLRKVYAAELFGINVQVFQ